ncbi:helicase-associated domain-containing protein, partial [Georgenia sp.]
MRTEALAAALAGRSDDELADLLLARPDLAAPAPSSLTALAARAGARPSVERALAMLDTVELAVVEAVVALAPLRHPADTSGSASAHAGPVPADTAGPTLALALGFDATPALARLADLALVLDGDPVPAVVDALGPHPAGLGPTLAEIDAVAPPGPDALAAPTTPEALRDALAAAPAAALGTLDALTWGPPVGSVSGQAALPEGAAWLVAAGVLRRVSPTQLVLPREVALAARGGRTHRVAPTPPDTAALRRLDTRSVDAEGARRAEEVVRLVALLLETWRGAPATVLRTGGIGVRELRRTAAELDLPEADAALVVELTAMAGLLSQDGADSVSWMPSAEALDWYADPLPLRWDRLVRAWLRSARTPWLVGTRSDQGALRAALEPTLERGWALTLRTRCAAALAGLPGGTAPTAAQVHAQLAWHHPRATPSARAVAAVLVEAEVLGLTGAGALTTAGQAVLDGADEDVVAAALDAALPAPVTELLAQGDLTAVVPGRPDRALADLLARCADVESRGSALTVRFTAESVRRALDVGLGAPELLEALTGYARGALPQALEYLVRDVARTHGRVRVGQARAYLRVDDDATAAGLLADPALAELSLRAVAPTVLISPAGPAEVLDALRDAGLAPVLEGPDGAVVVPPGGLGTRGPGDPNGRRVPS